MQADEIIPLRPEGAPNPIAGVGAESAYRAPAGVAAGKEMLRNISQATLSLFRPARANGVGVIICPGGGWRILAWEHEGLDLAAWLTARGYTAFLLKYRVMGTPADPAEFAARMAAMDGMLAETLPAARAPRRLRELVRDDAKALAASAAAADDGRRALAIVRERAKHFDVDPARVGMIGFSAGAFLTADVAMAPGGPPLAFAAPIYGGDTRGAPVPGDAPALFTTIAQDDRYLFKIVEQLWMDWSNADRPAALHIFNRGGHGFGMVRQAAPTDRWIDLFEDWLKDLGLA